MSNHPFPYREALVGENGMVSDRWRIYFRDLDLAQAASQTVVVSPVSLVGQVASIVATPIPTGALAQGLYEVKTFMRITTPGGVTSDLTVRIGFTNGGVACSIPGALLASNTTASVQSNSWPIVIDASSPITYSTVRNSNPAGDMVYTLTVSLTQIALT